jgi:hypothetical protein
VEEINYIGRSFDQYFKIKSSEPSPFSAWGVFIRLNLEELPYGEINKGEKRHLIKLGFL